MEKKASRDERICLGAGEALRDFLPHDYKAFVFVFCPDGSFSTHRLRMESEQVAVVAMEATRDYNELRATGKIIK